MPKRFSHKLYGLIGNPVAHSLSPYMHNAAFFKLNIDAAYLPFLVKKGKLKQAISALKATGISGFNVTVPFKSECIKYLDKIDPLAKAIGAVNTVINKNGRLIGYNTDCMGFLRSIKEDLGFDPIKKNIFVLGAGGVSRAIAFGLAQCKANRIIIYDIMPVKARYLTADIKKNFPDIDILLARKEDIPRFIGACHLLVNCTPIGMKPKDPLPVRAKLLHKNLKVYDVVYTPLKTRLIRAAEKKSVKAAGGINMLLYQGVLAFELWTGRKAPVALMRKELLKQLK
jgi:shikimate dehydrogenase